jgi:hypothetical protein
VDEPKVQDWQALARAVILANASDPFEAKLERIGLLDHGLAAREGAEQATAEEQEPLEGMQRAANAHNRALREQAQVRPASRRRRARQERPWPTA